jgi:hypothetical protein
MDADTVIQHQLHEALKLRGLPVQPAGVPDEQPVPPAIPQPIAEFPVGGAGVAAAVGGHVVVYELVRFGQSQARGQRAHVLELGPGADACTVTVLRNPGVGHGDAGLRFPVSSGHNPKA